jgi:hypothetical protein
VSAYALLESLVVYTAVAAAAGYALWRLVPPLRRRLGGLAGRPSADSACGGCSACGAAQRGCQEGAALAKAGASGLPGEKAHAPLDTGQAL